jgi:hypothetical protein
MLQILEECGLLSLYSAKEELAEANAHLAAAAE